MSDCLEPHSTEAARDRVLDATGMPRCVIH